MNFLNFLSATAENSADLAFNPMNFIGNLRYMGLGMLVIFVIIGIIILTTLLINKVFNNEDK